MVESILKGLQGVGKRSHVLRGAQDARREQRGDLFSTGPSALPGSREADQGRTSIFRMRSTNRQTVSFEPVHELARCTDRDRQFLAEFVYSACAFMAVQHPKSLERGEADQAGSAQLSLDRVPEIGLEAHEELEELHVGHNSTGEGRIPGNILPLHAVGVDMQNSLPPSVEFDRVQVRYGQTEVLRDVSLTIESGSFTVLLGPSGSGKTTLLRTVNRMVEPSGGRVLLDGADVATQDVVRLRRSIGYVMQSSGLFPHRTVLDNVATVPRLRGASRAQARATALATIERIGLGTDLANRYPSQLSGGQQQRVGVARALAASPQILLMDEPFGAVDPITRRALPREILELHARTRVTVLFVTHDVDEALALGDRILILDTGGRIAQDAMPTEVLANPADDFVANMLGTASGDRSLRIQAGRGAELVVDRSGRPVGVLER
jgi:osmoprotectant transport system ATP-binding protein